MSKFYVDGREFITEQTELTGYMILAMWPGVAPGERLLFLKQEDVDKQITLGSRVAVDGASFYTIPNAHIGG